MFFELRLYRIAPGRRSEWVHLMESEIIPYQASKGMVILGSFIDIEDPNLYIWLRRFESEEQREALYDAVYGSAHWKEVIRPKISELLIRDETVVHRLAATAMSPISVDLTSVS